MATPARVESVAAIGEFRASLLLFMTKSRRALDDAADTVRRTRVWLEEDRKRYWDAEFRRRQKVLDQAEQEALTARMKNHPEILAVRQAAVRKARAAVEEAATKLRVIRQWSRDFESLTAPRVKALESLRHTLDFDLPKAVALLDQTERELEAYAEPPPPAS